jgi:hypothetical protein
MAKTKASAITSFTARLPLAELAADHAAEMVTNVSDESRAAVKAIIVRAVKGEMPPYAAARLIRSCVGLSVPAALAVTNYRAELVALGLPSDKVEGKVQRYADKLRRQRARLVAATEVQRALSAGQQHGWEHAVSVGLLPATARRRWMATAAGTKAKLCAKCAALDGTTAPLDGPFADGTMRPPRHPSCRCTLGLEP